MQHNFPAQFHRTSLILFNSGTCSRAQSKCNSMNECDWGSTDECDLASMDAYDLSSMD